MRKILFITSTRADYGLLKSLMYEVQFCEYFQLQVLVTGSHLSENHGHTIDEIIKDGFIANFKIKMNLTKDKPCDIVKAMGNELIQFASAYDVLKPDMIVVLGDRYEILIAVQAANIYTIPVSHFCGGDISEGSYDNNTRHAITKLSHLHFATNKYSVKRIIQMGENPKNVFNYGNPGLELLVDFKATDEDKLEKILNAKLKLRNIVVVYHPDTLNYNGSDINELVSAIEHFANNSNIYLLRSNCDNNNNIIHEKFNRLAEHKNIYYYNSLERIHFLSLVYYSDIFVGNSSSGIYEIPFLNKYVINIGNRQGGRLKSNLVIDCKPNRDEIISNVEKYSNAFIDKAIHPYPLLKTSKLFIKKLIEINNFKKLLKKSFYIYNDDRYSY